MEAGKPGVPGLHAVQLVDLDKDNDSEHARTLHQATVGRTARGQLHKQEIVYFVIAQ